MFDSNGVLTDRARGILFWVTISLIALVAIVIMVTLVRAVTRIVSSNRELPTLAPSEVNVCAGKQQQFATTDDGDVTWEATGGTISEDGVFTAGDKSGDYAVTVSRGWLVRESEAIVHVILCTPAPTLMPTAVVTSTPIPATPGPTDTAIPEATVSPAGADARGDVGSYETGAPVADVPPGVDIREASPGSDLRINLQPSLGVPESLAGWPDEDEILLWISLYEPISSPPTAYTDWLFAIDADGDVATGRPAGSARINPDIGDDAVLGVTYDAATGEYDPYLLVWDAAQEQWIVGSEPPRYIIGETGTVIALAMPLETLAQTLSETSDVTLLPDGAMARASVLSYVGEQRVIDFYPDRPE